MPSTDGDQVKPLNVCLFVGLFVLTEAFDNDVYSSEILKTEITN